ncbi:BPG_G0000040.mRNA.1.CDS.1 [Saccharomyces cerevisiae]|nr:BPG_G0000040.mRNA.1.CDS.1 [Saccharomyces cerevisiae]CAI7032938.1 BPG_G0000040.mRNA.1.CDS.1 [Saccharomyces cerevisiae]
MSWALVIYVATGVIRTCNMVEAAQKQNRITFGSIYVKLHPLVKLCTGIVWAPRV